MKKQIILSVSVILSLIFGNAMAQPNATDNISADSYSLELMQQLIVDSINIYRTAAGAEALALDDVLSSAAGDQADYMTKEGAISLEQGKAAKNTTGKRVRYYGGSSSGSEEVVLYIPCAKGKEAYSYVKTTSDLMLKMMKNKKNSAILTNKTYQYAGIGATMDGGGKKLYISILLGTEEAIMKGK